MATQPTIQTINDPRYTDLVLDEDIKNYSHNSRDVVSVTATTGGTFPMGSVIFRPKAITASAVWDFVDAAETSQSLTITQLLSVMTLGLLRVLCLALA